MHAVWSHHGLIWCARSVVPPWTYMVCTQCGPTTDIYTVQCARSVVPPWTYMVCTQCGPTTDIYTVQCARSVVPLQTYTLYSVHAVWSHYRHIHCTVCTQCGPTTDLYGVSVECTQCKCRYLYARCFLYSCTVIDHSTTETSESAVVIVAEKQWRI